MIYIYQGALYFVWMYCAQKILFFTIRHFAQIYISTVKRLFAINYL